jgi:hypothetical protein
MKKNKISNGSGKIRFLFKDFLNNKRVYVLNQNYWKRLISKLIPEEKITESNWYNDQFANGQKMYDGNPIFSVLISPKKSLRIIQEEPESNHPEISAWLEKTEGPDGEEINELVISLELSDVTRELSEDLVQAWLEGKTDSSFIEEIANSIK